MDHHTFFSWYLCLAFIYSVGQASYTSGHGSKARDQQVTQTGHGGQHKGHGHSALGKKDELEEELLKLKGSTNEDTGFTSLRDLSRGGQPEFTNEDLEEELTEVRPLDIPLHLLQVETVEEHDQDRYATSTMRAFGELDLGGLTTVSSRLSELHMREELEADFRSDTDFGDWDQDDDDFKSEEANHSGDHSGVKSNLSPPHVSTTEQYNAVDVDKKAKQKVKLSDDDDEEDDDDDGDESDEADDESEGDDDEDDEPDDDDDEDDDDDGDEDDEDDDDDDDDDENSEGEKEENKKQTLTVKKSVDTVKPKHFEDSVEHGRQWKESTEEEDSQETKETSTPDREEWSPLTTSTPETARGALERDFATFLRNGSPEMEEHESRNVSEEAIEEDERNKSSRHKESEEAEFDTVHKLEQVRELDKKANIPQKLVDSVSPKADEDLLELMVRIAENPTEWQRVHNVLQQLDQDLVSSRKSLEEVKSLQKSSHRTEKKKDGEDAINALSNKTEVTKEHRKHQQGEKKKKKKKKQRQKEKLKNKAEKEKAKLKGKGKEEIRREELEKAGVLPPTNLLFKGKEKGKTSKGSIETSKTKSYWTKSSSSSKDSTHTKIKGNSLPFVDLGKNSNVNQKEILEPAVEPKEIKYVELGNNNSNRKEANDRMSSIDSAIAYLSEPTQSLDDINNKLPDENKNNKYRHPSNWVKMDDIDNRIDDSWPSNEDILSNNNNKNKWYGTVSNTKLNKDINIPKGNQNIWDKQLTGSGISKFREFARNDLIGSSQYNVQDKDGATYSWKNSGTNFNNWPDASKTNPKEERRYFSGEPVYNSPNTGWPQYSVESLKHGNLAGNVKTWPDMPIDQSLGSNKDYNTLDRTPDWPNLPLGTSVSKTKGASIYTWPNYSDNNTKQNSIITGKINSWSKPNLESEEAKQREILANTWSQMPQQQKPSVIDSAIAHHSKEPANNKQWPHFAYHRVTSSPQILAQQQKEAQQRARHRNAYIAVSVIAPPGKNKVLNKSQNKNNSIAAASSLSSKNKTNDSPVKPSVSPLPDKMDQLLTMRSEDKKFPDGDMLEEQLVDMVVAGEQQRYGEQGRIPWSHARHLDKIQEQLKTLSAMGEKLRYHWLEKERLLQILRDGGKSGSSFYRTQRDGSSRQETVSTTSSAPISSTTNSPSLHTTTQHPVSP